MWRALQDRISAARKLAQIGPVPAEWVDQEGFDGLLATLESARAMTRDLDERETQLFGEFEPAIVDVVDRDMIVRYRTDYQSVRRHFPGSKYRADRRSMRGLLLRPTKTSLSQELQLIEKVWQLRQKGQQWKQVEVRLAVALGHRNQGRDTRWDAVGQELHEAWHLITNPPGDARRMAALLTQADAVAQAQEVADAFAMASAQVETWLAGDLNPELMRQVKDDQITLDALMQLAGTANAAAERIRAAAGGSLAAAMERVPDVQALKEYLDCGDRLRALEAEHAQSKEALRSAFGDRFIGPDTDWAEVLVSVAWAEKLTALLGPDRWTADLLVHAEKPLVPLESYAHLEQFSAAVLKDWRTLMDKLNADYTLMGETRNAPGHYTFEGMRRWAEALNADAAYANDWLEYQAAFQQLDEVIGVSATELIREQTDDSTLVPDIIERQVVSAWLDWLYSKETLLAGFAALEQEDRINKFRELDGRLADAARNVVRTRAFGRYPNFSDPISSKSGLGTLRHELNKTRRQMPVRRLFRTIPTLIQTLKPCWLVSPLAVSQYLPLSETASEMLTFDVIIFDEASQVYPEDAVPAVLRGGQLILAGDQQQLPPTNFWHKDMEEDDDYDDDSEDIQSSDALRGMQSILDAAVGQVGRLFSEAHLNVHYRSKDESLIRFSNHYFYRNRLLTFPSPGMRDSWYGVHDVYVSDGRYDAGGTRANRIEAERVVDLVFDHYRTRAVGETLGVVALSRPQADLIESLIYDRRTRESDVEERFRTEGAEPFFVKNLENVQGDERDRIIVSIGYGPVGTSGAVPQRFGPIIREGGERRLNVVVSRARQRVDLVHSMKASDIHSQQLGARLLRSYLEYAENPARPLAHESIVSPTGEYESPFEEAVGRALEAKGYRIAKQVGAAGYRIDLAVLSDDGARCVLGIECDGATYHSAPAARDRDWLRQQVLESIGWKLHRVWSTAWVRNPEAELERIEGALATARLPSAEEGGGQPSPKVPGPAEPDPPTRVVRPYATAELQLEPYRETSLPRPKQWAELESETTEVLIRLIQNVAEVEGPVHKDVVIERLRRSYGVTRVVARARDRIEYEIGQALRRSEIHEDEEFIWLGEGQLERAPRLPVDGKIEHVPPSEIKAVILGIVRSGFGIPRNDISPEVARRLGFNRTGKRIAEVTEAAIQALLSDDSLIESYGRVHAKEAGSQGRTDEYVHDAEAERPTSSSEPSTTPPLAVERPKESPLEAWPPVGAPLIDRIRALDLVVIDNRSSGGPLWIFGGQELESALKPLEGEGIRFGFAPSGGKATRNRPAWWTNASQ